MSYEIMEKTFRALPEEQQNIVYNLILSLGNLAHDAQGAVPRKRSFGKFAGIATATFSEDWEMSEAERCEL